MTLAEITALITANIDTTGRRLTTGIKMREVLNGIVAYLTGVPDFAVSGVVFTDGSNLPDGVLGASISVPQGGIIRVVAIATVSRGKNWADISISGSGDPEYSVVSAPSTLPSTECITGVKLDLDTYAAGTYTYTLTIGGIDRSIIIEVEA